MAPTLIAIGGPSRSGKGTCASIFTDGAQGLGLTTRERQLSGPGKQYVASAWWPEITEDEAIERFDEMKTSERPARVTVNWDAESDLGTPFKVFRRGDVLLQQYLQRMLQGARDRWGADFWTDKLIPGPVYSTLTDGSFSHYTWWEAFRTNFERPGKPVPADLCLISDLRQPNEAERVKALGGYVIEMRRPPIEHSYVTGADHITEQGLPDHLVDYVIEGFADHNDETFAVLKERCWLAFATFVHPLLEPEGAATA